MELLDTIIKVFLAAILSGFGWALKTLHSDHKELNKELNELKTSLPEKYILKSDFSEFKEELFKRLDRIETKIDKN